MRHCPSCRATYDDDVEACPSDGTPLEDAPPPLDPSPADATGDDASHSDAFLTTLHSDSGPVTGSRPRAAADEDGEPELTPGSMLGAVYEVVRKVGQGGMGAVYEVEHKRMRKRYAAKVLRRDVSSNNEYVQRLEREAIAASRIDHPNIVRVVNLDETEEGQVFLIMDYLEGQDLGDVLAEGRLEPATALTVGTQVAGALHKVHERGIIHRDLKPENIFLAREEDETVVKLLDFGVSKLDLGEDDARLTKTGCVIGTPLYMSPEHARGEVTLDRRADIYSLGVILYETLTGRPPFEGTKTIEVMLKHVSEQPKPPSAVEPSLGEPLDELLLKALAKEPADRHQTMAEFAEAMVGAAAAIGVTAGQLPELREGVSRPPPSLTPAPVALTASGTQTPGVRSRIWALAGVALLALVGGGVFVALQLSTGTTPGRPVEEEAAAPPGSAVPGSRAEADRPPPTAGGSSAAGARPAGPPPEAEAASTPPSEPRPSPPQAAEPATVRISLKSRPTGAAVFLGDDQLGLTPLEHEQPFGREAVEFTFRKKGHEATVEQVVPDERQTVTATLDRSRAPRQATKTKRSVFRSNR